ncbi:MAG: OmpA family protein [Deltaproteobacteria bacterium]|nr:OmpA family protein [Deltaproteobacteria bacterium]
MKNIAIIVLSVLLAAVLVFGFILYKRHLDTKESLPISEKNLSELNEKVSRLNQEISKFQDQVRKNAERLKQLEAAQARISKLEKAITMKDQIISEFEKTTRTLEQGLEKEKKANENLKAEFASKDAIVTELQEGVQGFQSNIIYLEEEIAKEHNEIEGLHRELLALKGEKTIAQTRIAQLKSTYEALFSDLKRQIENKEVTIKAFEEKISVTFVDRILFDFGKASITAEGRMILKRVGEILKKVQGRKIRVVGHSDNRPILPGYQYKFPSNWELSSARAAAVVREFQKAIGLDPGNLEAVGRSFYDPVASNETAEGRARNRRVEIIIAPKIE